MNVAITVGYSVIFLFGESIKRVSEPLGMRHCPVCNGNKPFSHVTENNYFQVFGLRVLPLEKIADYQQCDYCENSFRFGPDVPALPSQVELIRTVIAYVLVGYGQHDHTDLAVDVANKVTGFDLAMDEFRADIRELVAGRLDLFAQIKQDGRWLNVRGKQQVIEAAFLVTHACCEIQYEDRLRLNMIATAMDISIAFVNATVEQVRRQGCYGVQRILPTQTQA